MHKLEEMIEFNCGFLKQTGLNPKGILLDADNYAEMKKLLREKEAKYGRRIDKKWPTRITYYASTGDELFIEENKRIDFGIVVEAR